MSWDTCFEGSSWGLPAREGLGVVGFSVSRFGALGGRRGAARLLQVVQVKGCIRAEGCVRGSAGSYNSRLGD